MIALSLHTGQCPRGSLTSRTPLIALLLKIDPMGSWEITVSLVKKSSNSKIPAFAAIMSIAQLAHSRLAGQLISKQISDPEQSSQNVPK